ncbi:MAG: DUF2723 domain-containing protein [Planctomycetota bacterium]
MTGPNLAAEEDKRARGLLAAGLFVVFAAVYIVFRSGYYNPDMTWQSCMAEGITSVTFPPDHLFYGVMVRWIWRAWQAVGLPGRAHVALQTVNALFGGVMVVTMFALTLRLTRRRFFAAFAAGICAKCYGMELTRRRFFAAFAAAIFGLTPYVWHHATDVETYGASKAFQLLAVYFTFLLAEGGEPRRRYRLAFTVAIFHAFAAFMQYLHVLLVPAVIVAAFVPRDGSSLATRVKTACVYLVTVGVLVWGPFLYVAITVRDVSSASELMAWLLAPDYGWPAFVRMSWLMTPLKFLSSFSSWPTPFVLPGHEAKRVVLGHISLGTYLSEHWWRIPIVGVLALLQLALLTRFVVWRKRIWPRWRSQIVVALVMILFYQGFSLYWGGGFAGHAIVAYFVLLQMAFAAVRETPREGRFTRVLAVATPWICAICAAAALLFSYVPEHDEKNNLALQETLEVAAKLSPKDMIFGPGGCLTSEYWWYFAPDRERFWLTAHLGRPGTKDPLGKLLAKADAAIAQVLKAGGKVYVHRVYADEDEVTRPWNEFLYADVHRKDVVDHFKRYKYEKAFVSHGHTYWRIVAPPEEPETREEGK